MRFVVVCALSLALLAGCTSSPTAAFDVKAFTGQVAVTTGSYQLGPLLHAYAVDGAFQPMGDYNVVTGATDPFTFPAADGHLGDGLSTAWFRVYVAKEAATGRNGTLTIESFEDGTAARERFVATSESQPDPARCVVAGVPQLDSGKAAAVAAQDPQLAAFAQKGGQYVYSYRAATMASEACGHGHAATWTVQVTDLGKSRAAKHSSYVDDSYVVQVDPNTGAILSSHEAGAHGFELAVSREVTVDVQPTDVLSPVNAEAPFNVTLAGSLLRVTAYDFSTFSQGGQGSYALVGPDGKSYAPEADHVPIGFGGAYFNIEDAPTGQWSLHYTEDAPVAPGERHIQATGFAILGDDSTSAI